MSLVAPSSILSSSSPLTLQLRIALPQRTHPSNLPLAPRLNRNLTSDLSSIPAYSRNTTAVSVYCLGPYGGGSILQDAGAASLVMGGAYALVSTFDKLSQRNIIKQVLNLLTFAIKITLADMWVSQSYRASTVNLFIDQRLEKLR